jgi:tetratricopeptide (TPR) repeat protein
MQNPTQAKQSAYSLFASSFYLLRYSFVILLILSLWVGNPVASSKAALQVPLNAMMQSKVEQGFNGSVWKSLAQVEAALSQGDNKQALQILTALHESHPTHVVVLKQLASTAEAYALSLTDETERILYYEAAYQHYERLLGLQPDLQQLQIKLALMANKLDRPQEALVWYKLAVRSYPENALLQFNLGNLYEELNKPDLAEEHYRKALINDPSLVFVYNNLALILEARGASDEAEALYKAALKLDKHYNLAQVNLASLYLDNQRWQEAKTQFEKLLKQTPDDPLGLMGYSKALLMLGENREALLSLERLSQLNPNNPNTYYLMAMAHLQLQQWPEALQACRHYLSLEPQGTYSQQVQQVMLLSQKTSSLR